jgi:hypothetical protein
MFQYITIVNNEPKLYMRTMVLFNGPRVNIGDNLICDKGSVWRVDEIHSAAESLDRELSKLNNIAEKIKEEEETASTAVWPYNMEYYE